MNNCGNEKLKWRYDFPKEVGWYPTLYCWDSAEGVFPSTHYWTGEKWTDYPTNSVWWSNALIVWLPIRCENYLETESIVSKQDLYV